MGSRVQALAVREQEQEAAVRSVFWDRTLFRSHEAEDRICPSVIDITGRQRHLLFGPGLQLPAGLWRATVSLELCPEGARRRLDVHFGVANEFVFETLHGVSGRQQAVLERRMAPGDLAEVRVWLKAPAFHGELRFYGAELVRLDDD